ncbi:type II toxin-antitoxin system HicA family toxin [Polynucleobacter sp. MG-28-Ekke-A2]|uniref:type II toxin-antitoxin system HicA family toxin n=1 Tax=Polynucleobacter sp. MG-28-Ekke-A2 TaxID=3108276 RepID=UPI002B23158F|nr:type II toxin-antitoxin system HicA family toxin [Polynucleobacter sp. MG-28-Ekke-A2]MEA9601081.1 type II toxin-antitoxin system HicA family toxin [Polynucleobacter sp. MG-28-Ekke-A2]
MELLLVAVGSKCVEGEGSRVSFLMNNHRLDLHRPHPGKEAKRYQVKDVQSFLVLIGVKL